MTRNRAISPPALSPWKVLESAEVFRAEPWITISKQTVGLPDGSVVDDFYQIGLADCVIVYATTADGRVIVERQYKHGPRRVGVSLPAGSIEPGETPLESARRELLEETGYVAENWDCVGSFCCNGNYGCGNAYLYTAGNATKTTEPDSGDLEDMQILLLEPQELTAAIFSGEIPMLGTAACVALASLSLTRKTTLSKQTGK